MSNLAIQLDGNLSKRGKDLLKSYSGEHKSKYNHTFVFEANSWRISGKKVLHFDKLPELAPECSVGFRAALSRYAEFYSDDHVRNMFAVMKKYLVVSGERSVTLAGVSKFKDSLNSDQEYVLGSIKGFWLSWYDWGLPGIDEATAKALERMTLSGNEKGAAVLRRCPYTGPLTELEQSALLEWAYNALSAKELSERITIEEFAYFLILLFTGRRSVQILSSRVADFTKEETVEGFNYEYRCPKAKQRGIGFRKKFNPLPINDDLYSTINKLIEKNVEFIEKHMGIKMSSSVIDTLPIFIHKKRFIDLDSYDGYLKKQKETPDHFQITNGMAGKFMDSLTKKCTAISERTGDFIHLSSRRFRYTKATNLVNLGINGGALADALDHADQQQLGVYTENTPTNARIIDEVMADTMAPVAQALAGTLIDSERDALRANDPSSRVRNDRGAAVGSCGKFDFCAFGHRSCYTCRAFQPWRDAPHHEVLEDLLAERKRQQERGVSALVIQSTDRVLLAVTQVIQMCKQVEVGVDVVEEALIDG